MGWEYKIEIADSRREALEILTRLDRDGWEALSGSGSSIGEMTLMFRRPRTPRTVPSSPYALGDIVHDLY
jgi:hypothetical protein